MVMLSDRPAEAVDRAAPGHWQGDLVLGEGGRSAVGTLVERTTRFTLLLHLREGRAATSVEDAMRRAIRTLPRELLRTVTWDQGAEMATDASFTVATGVPIYFCDLHSPWQREATRTPMGCCANTCRRAAICRRRRQPSSEGSNESTTGDAESSASGTRSEKLSEVVALTG